MGMSADHLIGTESGVSLQRAAPYHRAVTIA